MLDCLLLPKWLAQQQKRLAARYESYWYSTQKGAWTKHEGWPSAEDWPKLQGWIVRRTLSPAAATRSSFPKEAGKIFRDVFPLVRFTSFPN